jgi:hypothetical protein
MSTMMMSSMMPVSRQECSIVSLNGRRKLPIKRQVGHPRQKYLEGLAKGDFGEFRAMIALQVCCLGEVIVKGHKNLNNLFYPVASLGAAAQLSHLKDKSERLEMLHTVI